MTEDTNRAQTEDTNGTQTAPPASDSKPVDRTAKLRAVLKTSALSKLVRRFDNFWLLPSSVRFTPFSKMAKLLTYSSIASRMLSPDSELIRS